MKKLLNTLILILLFNNLQAQWFNKSTGVYSSLERIKQLDSTFYILGNNYLYGSSDSCKTFYLAGYDFINKFNDVFRNADTVYVTSYNNLNSNYYYHQKYFKILPNTKFIDTTILNSFLSDYNFSTLRYEDSIVWVFQERNIRRLTNQYSVVSAITQPYVVYKGGFSRGYFWYDSLVFKALFQKNSTFFVLNNYEPGLQKSYTAIVRREIKKITPNQSQFDNIPNLPYSKSLYMFNDTAGVIIGDTFIAKSDNYINWKIEYTNNNCNFNQVWFVNRDTGYVVGSKNGKALILKSFDGGITWKEQRCPVTAPLNDIKFTEDGRIGIIVGDSGTILRTTNGGGNQFVGISSKISSPSQITIYPNPALNFLNIKSEGQPANLQFSIFNYLGIEVMTGYLNSPVNTLDINNLVSGLYYFQAGIFTYVFVKN